MYGYGVLITNTLYLLLLSEKGLNQIMEDYENKVRISHNKGGWRQLNKVWMKMHVSQPKVGPLLTSTVSGLLDVGISIHLLTGVDCRGYL